MQILTQVEEKQVSVEVSLERQMWVLASLVAKPPLLEELTHPPEVMVVSQTAKGGRLW